MQGHLRAGVGGGRGCSWSHPCPGEGSEGGDKRQRLLTSGKSLGSLAAGRTTRSCPHWDRGLGLEAPGWRVCGRRWTPRTVFSRGSSGRELRDEGVCPPGVPPTDGPRAGLSWRAVCWRSPRDLPPTLSLLLGLGAVQALPAHAVHLGRPLAQSQDQLFRSEPRASRP